jgi:zinc transporter ZupT
MGFGGGAMLYITVKEVFPEAYSEGRSLCHHPWLFGGSSSYALS